MLLPLALEDLRLVVFLRGEAFGLFFAISDICWRLRPDLFFDLLTPALLLFDDFLLLDDFLDVIFISFREIVDHDA